MEKPSFRARGERDCPPASIGDPTFPRRPRTITPRDEGSPSTPAGCRCRTCSSESSAVDSAPRARSTYCNAGGGFPGLAARRSPKRVGDHSIVRSPRSTSPRSECPRGVDCRNGRRPSRPSWSFAACESRFACESPALRFAGSRQDTADSSGSGSRATHRELRRLRVEEVGDALARQASSAEGEEQRDPSLAQRHRFILARAARAMAPVLRRFGLRGQLRTWGK